MWSALPAGSSLVLPLKVYSCPLEEHVCTALTAKVCIRQVRVEGCLGL